MKYLPKNQSTGLVQRQSAFTLIEILIVLTIVSILAAGLGVSINNMMTSAREAQTTATLRKIDGLINERQQGLQRAFEGRDFIRYVNSTSDRLRKGDPANGVGQLFDLSNKAVEAIARKDFTRDFFPQRFIEMIDNGGDGIPDRIQLDEVYGGDNDLNNNGSLDGDKIPGNGIFTEDVNDNGVFDPSPVRWTDHDQITESSELLHFALTRMEVFGTPLTSVDDFSTREVADTDNDGLPEFIDGWGNPLRFYRWPTRLFKPYGLYGFDQEPGKKDIDEDGEDLNGNGMLDPSEDVNGNGVLDPGEDVNGNGVLDPGEDVNGNGILDGVLDDAGEIGWPGTDDVVISDDVRNVARTYIAGLPRAPVVSPTTGLPIPGDYDQLNIDPDDAFGILLHTAQPLAAQGIFMLTGEVSESRYHTLDTYHRPLVVSAGADGVLGLYEPFHSEDAGFLNGLLDTGSSEDSNGNGFLDLGILAQPYNENAATGDLNGNGLVDTFATPFASFDDLTNHNRRAGE